MEKQEKRHLLGFYENELTNNLLFYWMPRCEDKKHGGFFNCFDNTGRNLMSTDKYIWSQGRFVWIFASLAAMKSDTFSSRQREEFKRLARQGRDFLKKHCLISENDWRCVYLTDEEGNHKMPEDFQILDASIYADCFVVNAFSKVAQMDSDLDSWKFAKQLYLSIVDRLKNENYHTLPYPMEHAYRAHGIPMIMTNVEKELYETAKILDPDFCAALISSLKQNVLDVLENFTDENNMVREVIRSNNEFAEGLLGTHINPGHTIENIWFILDAIEIVPELKSMQIIDKLCSITEQALKTGWDNTYGGIYHYADYSGGILKGNAEDYKDVPVLHYALKNTSGKIWWVHSEALYTTMRLYFLTGRTVFWKWYQQIEEYVFKKFPNPDREVREWIQTLNREGQKKEKAVGLPVKDPYHIMRNVLLIIELLYSSDETCP